MKPPPANPHFFLDPRVEQLLTRERVKFHVANISIAAIDLEASENNQARHEPIDEERVQRFSDLLLAGVLFPAIVALGPVIPSGTYIVMGGNHRVRASIEAGLTEVLAYVFFTEDEQIIRMLPVLLNVLEGERTPADERLEHAIFAIRTYGWTSKLASEKLSISVERVNRILHTDHARQRLQGLGAQDTSRISDSTLAELDGVQNDTIMLAIFDLASRERLSLEGTREVIKASRRGRTEAKALEEIASHARELFPAPPLLDNGESSPRPRAPRTSKAAIYRAILNRHLNFLKDYPTLTKMGVTDKREKEWFVQRRDELMRLLRAL